jgi:hypothetical protein
MIVTIISEERDGCHNHHFPCRLNWVAGAPPARWSAQAALG